MSWYGVPTFLPATRRKGALLFGGELMKKLLSALACGALLLFGGMSVARADYYEMYNPATHVEGGAMVYETTRAF